MINEIVRICGLDKSQIEQRLNAFKGCGAKITVEEDCLDASITMSADLTPLEFENIRFGIYNAFKNDLYSSDNANLQETAARLLKLGNNTLAVAESLTGGEVCSRLAEIPGISANLYEGIVCYDKRSKTDRLGVKRQTLDRFGAVSRETAYEMVEGLLGAPVDVAVATTGLAGPSGDEGKPVGLVYIAVGGDYVMAFEKHFTGSRNQIRQKATNMALFYLIRYLKGDLYTL